ncbi:Chlorophyll synthase, chloroplastic [Tetrabaena socialis]|uniref:Chlorophyll synthase, chloroplastic n=1 Tax=Tetrabaena socialis TaxID=47790 RepID=A0A2J8A8T4_9CHLO|nr:Chlorophyll synthase, chloroplastic [Tetrabaena socialis]|eukprot:PNH08873.1 Chlorophyll synthase, chloroplastic [Tetrabaena socialis]
MQALSSPRTGVRPVARSARSVSARPFGTVCCRPSLGRVALKAVNKQATEKEKSSGNSTARQLLGMKGAALETDIWKIRLQLTKPVTWIPLIWGVGCGAAASGNYQWNDPVQIAQLLACMVMSGPFLTGYTQTINDWYDRDIDAINEPYRPIPSGRISKNDVIAQIWVLLLGGLGLGYALDTWVGHETPTLFYLTVFGSFISYIYSAPPLKLKQSGWAGNYALGSSYIALPWWAGQALFGTLTPDVMALTVAYSLAGLGIAIVNDFKSIEGDRWVLEIFFQYKYFLPDPIANDVKYQASAQPFLVFGLLTTGLAIGHMNQVAAAAASAL